MSVTPAGGLYEAGQPRLLVTYYPPAQHLERALRETFAKPLPIHNRTVLHLLEALQIL